MLPAWDGGVACSSTHPVPNQERGALRNTRSARPSQTSILERTAPCDLILAWAVGQEGSCNAHFPCAKTRQEADTPKAKVWWPEPEVRRRGALCIERAMSGRTLCLGQS